MKKAFISFLIMTLMLTNISLVNISSVQAATTTADSAITESDNTIKVSLDNISDIMIENNLNIKILHNNLEISNDAYHADLDDYNNALDDYEATYNENYDENDDAPTVSAKPDSSEYTGGTSDPQYVIDYNNYLAENDKLEAYNKCKTAKSTYETAWDDYKTAKASYGKEVSAKVIAAQQAYINYVTNLSDTKLKEDTVKSNEKEEKVYKLQYENGFISKNEYNSLLQGNTTPVNKLKELKDTEELARVKLCNTLGISPEKKITFNTDITNELEVISKINYSDDLGKMLSNNVDMKLQNDKIDDLADKEDDYKDNDQEDKYDYLVENADNELKQLINTAETDFKGQYNTLINSYNSLKSSIDSLNIEKNTYSIMQTKYDYGFVSKKDVDDAKLALDTDEAALQTEKNTLYVNYLSYLQMKEGY